MQVENPYEIAELVVRVFADEACGKIADASYLFHEIAQNENSVIKRGVELIKSKRVHCIAISGSNAISGYAGFNHWRNALILEKIPAKTIVRVGLKTTIISNTYMEALELVKLAKEERWQNIYVTAAPFHQLRAFVTVVSVALTEYPCLKIFSVPGCVLTWSEKISLFQGKIISPRNFLSRADFVRLSVGISSEELRPISEIIKYLDSR